MSAMLVSYETTDRAMSAVALATPFVSGVALRDQFGCVCPEGATKIGRLALALNDRAVVSRYQERVPVATHASCDYVFEARAIHTIRPAWPPHNERVALFKSLSFFIYQCDEDGTQDDPLLAELRKAQSAFACELVAELPAYAVAPWD